MNPQHADGVYPALAAVTTGYAYLLDRNKQSPNPRVKLEPDWTWVEVVLGTTLCLAAAAIRIRLAPGDARDTERVVWRAFVWGGAPIAIWQVGRAYLRQKHRADTLSHYNHGAPDDHQSRPPAPPRVAPFRRPGQGAYRGDRDGVA